MGSKDKVARRYTSDDKIKRSRVFVVKYEDDFVRFVGGTFVELEDYPERATLFIEKIYARIRIEKRILPYWLAGTDQTIDPAKMDIVEVSFPTHIEWVDSDHVG